MAGLSCVGAGTPLIACPRAQAETVGDEKGRRAMCGIGGVIQLDAKPDIEPLQRMAAALAHRGPDDLGIEIVGNVGLVHTRLSIVDPSPAGHQPMRSADGSWWISYNGEVYNHLDLRRRHGAGRSYRGGSDTETILELIAARGLSAVADLEGIFGFAAFDVGGHRLSLCRDAFGVKPLYYARTDGALWFASEVAALQAAGVPARPRVDAVRHVLRTTWVNGPVTVFEGISRVDPGSTLSVDTRTLACTVTSWYDPADQVDAEFAGHLASLDRARTTEIVEQHLRTAVSRQLMSDVPLGTMCSGGIDSSLLTAFARDELPHLHAFNVSIADQPDRDESKWASAVAEHLDVELHTIELDRDGWLEGLVPAVKHFEYPLSYEASVGLAALAGRAHAEGVKVLLSGEGADELLGGYPWLHQSASADFFARTSPVRRARRTAARLLRRQVDVKGGGCAESDEYDQLVRSNCAAAYRRHRGARGRLEALMLSDFRVSLPQILARGDKNTMQHSIESRVPFLDRDLVRLCINLPLEHRLEPHRKNPLVELAARHLPAGVAVREKVAFNFDVSGYLRSTANPAFVERGLIRELLGDAGEAWPHDLGLDPFRGELLLWTTEIWARLFLGGETVDAVQRELFSSGSRRSGASLGR